MKVSGLILAGGRASRMGGGDKCLIAIGGRSILAHLIERLAPQVETLAIGANGDPARFEAFGLPVLPDAGSGGTMPAENEGPLAGIVAGLAWAEACGHNALLAVSGDTPFIPRTLGRSLAAAMSAAPACCAVARFGGEPYPLASLWATSLRSDVETRFRAGDRAVRIVQRSLGAAHADFDGGYDPFLGANTPADIEALETLWESGAVRD